MDNGPAVDNQHPPPQGMDSAAELNRLQTDGNAALAQFFESFCPRLERIIEFRMDERIRRRVDPSDVLQEAFLELTKRLPEYLANPTVSLFVWIRQKTIQKLIDLQREHFRDKRDITKEQILPPSHQGNDTGTSIQSLLSLSLTSPSQHLIRNEEVQKLQTAMRSLSDLDQEVLALRHFEQLSNQQVAEILNLNTTAASNRYVRALSRLSESLADSSRDSTR